MRTELWKGLRRHLGDMGGWSVRPQGPISRDGIADLGICILAECLKAQTQEQCLDTAQTRKHVRSNVWVQ